METIMQIDAQNIDSEHICCSIGNDKANRDRAATKKAWLKERFDDGLVFKRLDERGKVFVEYVPIEKVWKPITGRNYMAINCLWVAGRFKGKGWAAALLQECISDAKAQGKAGVVYVSASKVEHYLTDKRFFLQHGFKVVDNAPPYFELLALEFDGDEDGATSTPIDTAMPSEPPAFTADAKTGSCPVSEGFYFVYSHQCPFMEEYVHLLADLARQKGYPVAVKQLASAAEAQAHGSPFGTLGIYFNGQLRGHAPMTEKGFEKFLAKLEV
ncbi:MAG: GNAT family N-acetyltransferase [Spirochaetota bacterium]